jgi:hypothetical protein
MDAWRVVECFFFFCAARRGAARRGAARRVVAPEAR